MLHFIPKLQSRGKWYKERKNLSVGDLVLVMDSQLARNQWEMAIVTKIYPGDDGLVRSVEIRSKSGLYDRPITKLCLLASKEELEHQNE